MTFTVTYRGADGALREEAIEATGRAECFVQMKARGIVPVSVKEGARKGRRQDGVFPHGRNELRPSRTSGDKPQSSIFNLKSSIILAAVLAVAGGAWWWLSAREDARPPVEKPKAVKDAKKVKDVKDLKGPKGTPAVPAATNNVAANPVAGTTASAHKEEVISAVTNKSGYIVERVRNPDGTTSKRVTAPPPIFSNSSDQMIALALSAQPGQSLPPMPANAVSNEEFLKSLEEEIVILDTDSPEVKDLKAKVIVAREDIKSMMKKGYSVQQVLDEHHQLFNDNAKLHADALIEMKAILSSGDRDGARRYAEKVNVALKQMGVPELPLPSKDGEEVSSTRARRLEAARERVK